MRLKGSFVRFLLVGALNTVVGLGISFLLFNVLRFGYWPSTFLGNTVGAVVSYVLNKTFTFRSKASVRSSWWKFGLVTVSCYAFSYSVSLLLASSFAAALPGWNEKLIHNGAILAGTGIYTIANYLGHKWFSFAVKDSIPGHPTP